MLRRLSALVTALVLLWACVAPPQEDDRYHVTIVSCWLDSGQVYAEITTYQDGYYRIEYADGQFTEWQYIPIWTTVTSVHGGSFEVKYMVEEPTKHEDDKPVIPKGGRFFAPASNCPQSTST